MTTTQDRAAPAPTGGAEALRELFRRIGADEHEREAERRLPFAQVDWLRAAGFGALRVPAELGGGGADLPELFEQVARLAAEDPNVAHLLRGHFAHVETQLVAPHSAKRTRWLADAVEGGIVGNASSERNGAPLTSIDTTLRREGARWLLTGRKYYSTGTIFADWITVSALRDGERVIVTVPAHAAGVRKDDDWDGFGQQLTGSGGTTFDDVEIDPEQVRPYRAGGPSHQTAFFQLYLVAVLAGIGRALVADAVGFVRPRTRSFVTGRGVLPREDPLVQHVVGTLSATSYAADELVGAGARAIQAAVDSAGPQGLDPDLVDTAELAVYRAQLVVSESVLSAATQLFEVGGASATSQARRLDRHWRNARTLASHNPVIYKARLLGDNLLNGTSPSADWEAWKTGPTGEQGG